MRDGGGGIETIGATQSVNDMLNDTGSAGNSRSRSRKASKDEIPDMSEASEKTPNRQRRTNAA